MFILAFAFVPIVALCTPEQRKLTINGHVISGSLLEREGRLYLSIEDLTQSLAGNLSYSGQQITMTLPSLAATVSTQAHSAANDKPQTDVDHPSPDDIQPSLLLSPTDLRSDKQRQTTPADNKLTEGFTVAAKHALGALERFCNHIDPFTISASVTDTYRTEADKSLEEVDISAKSNGDREVRILLSRYHLHANGAFHALYGGRMNAEEYRQSLGATTSCYLEVKAALDAGMYASDNKGKCI